MNMLKISIKQMLCTCALFSYLVLASNVSMAQEAKQMKDAKLAERIAWWRDAKFGLFIHWGAYSKAGGEWNGETNHAEWLQFSAKIPLAEYTEFAKQFLSLIHI